MLNFPFPFANPTSESAVAHHLFDKHRATLDRALQAIAERSYWSAYPESPSPRNYGEGAVEQGPVGVDECGHAMPGRDDDPRALTVPVDLRNY